jgi:hypothetical protein
MSGLGPEALCSSSFNLSKALDNRNWLLPRHHSKLCELSAISRMEKTKMQAGLEPGYSKKNILLHSDKEKLYQVQIYSFMYDHFSSS